MTFEELEDRGVPAARLATPAALALPDVLIVLASPTPGAVHRAPSGGAVGRLPGAPTLGSGHSIEAPERLREPTMLAPPDRLPLPSIGVDGVVPGAPRPTEIAACAGRVRRDDGTPVPGGSSGPGRDIARRRSVGTSTSGGYR